MKLRKDVFENPEKYEKILTTYKENPVTVETKTTKDIRAEEWDYWYRVYNDGYNPWDNLPQLQFYMSYKEWVDKVDKKAYNTLKYVITRLINDFEH